MWQPIDAMRPATIIFTIFLLTAVGFLLGAVVAKFAPHRAPVGSYQIVPLGNSVARLDTRTGELQCWSAPAWHDCTP